ncbi:EAL domain-containing protein [Vibrio sonorensis]|uniref:EAL domain-containing protein n=1 Tax=Vibrio sonorensis TaxID=1004316 RepID=UPI0008DA0419|nr:EAL domain-containing protein [Vibrio sonorensis]
MMLSTHQQFEQCLEENDSGHFQARYKDLTLSSVYQPIFCRNENIIGVEALVRLKKDDGSQIRPDLFFHSSNVSMEDKVSVERLSRVIHIRNFSKSNYRKLNLFLNVLPSVGEYYALMDINASLLAKRLDDLDIDRSQMVMELVELSANNEANLKQAMDGLADNGFRIAVDDFGTEASNRERVESIRPSILKLDRSLLLQYIDGITEPLLSGIKLAQSIGAQIVIEGIETSQQYAAMRQLDIDMFQGYFLAMPKALSPSPSVITA